MKISSVAQMRAMDRNAIEQFGIPDQILMENAGRTSFEALARAWGVRGKRYAVFCGSGNNAGDGLVVARHILSNGGRPFVFLSAIRSACRGRRKTTLSLLQNCPSPWSG